ncbi:MAG: hypothetical protein MR300_09720 [Ruminococcus sp.]|nr:hypothetical protein [Ruminococcus sp.]
MNKLQKKNRLQSGNSGDDKKRKTFTVKSITRKAEKIKCATTTKELDARQRSVIKRIYCESHNRAELVNNLKALQFCTYEIVVESLREQGLIDNEDYYSLMTEVER